MMLVCFLWWTFIKLTIILNIICTQWQNREQGCRVSTWTSWSTLIRNYHTLLKGTKSIHWNTVCCLNKHPILVIVVEKPYLKCKCMLTQKNWFTEAHNKVEVPNVWWYFTKFAITFFSSSICNLEKIFVLPLFQKWLTWSKHFDAPPSMTSCLTFHRWTKTL